MIDLLLQRSRKTGDISDPDTWDNLRRIVNCVRVATVSNDDRDLDYAGTRPKSTGPAVRVILGTDRQGDKIKSGWLRWMTRRAAGDIDWWAPEKNEQVLIVAPSGNLRQAWIIGSMYRPDSFPAPQIRETIHYTRYADGTEIWYDRAASLLKANCVGAAELVAAGHILATSGDRITATAAVKITAAAPEIELNGHVTVNGNVQVNGNVNASGTIIDAIGNTPHHHH